MEFTLFYRGELKANGGPKDKHRLRRAFHPQLRRLWSQAPLDGFVPRLLQSRREIGASRPAGSTGVPVAPNLGDDDLCLTTQVGPFVFAPLVSSRVHVIAELHLTLLRPEPPGAIVSSGGDIDNRVKTLLDALRAPTNTSELPSGLVPEEDETPFFCLLQDDRLVTKLTIATQQLLEPNVPSGEVVLLIQVQAKQTKLLMGTIGLT